MSNPFKCAADAFAPPIESVRVGSRTDQSCVSDRSTISGRPLCRELMRAAPRPRCRGSRRPAHGFVSLILVRAR